MNKISPNLLNDTLNLIQLARETALAKGQEDQAKRLTPVMNGMRTLVAGAQEPAAAARPAPASLSATPASAPTQPAPGSLLAQNDFRALLEAANRRPAPGAAGSPAAPAVPHSAERNQMVGAMAQGGMAEIDIARQMGMTRDEVHTILSIQRG